MALKNKKLTMGNIICAAGLWFKAVQLCLMFFGVSAAFAPAFTLIVTCITVGGFCVAALERRGRGSVFALCTAVCILGGVMSAAQLRIISASAMFLTFVFYILLLCTAPKSRITVLISAAVGLSAVLLFVQMTGLIEMPAAAVGALLVFVYAIMGVGIVV